MNTSNNYSNAPIVEALIDFKVIPNSHFEMAWYDIFQKNKLIDVFSGKSSIEEITANIGVASDAEIPPHSRKKIGIRLETFDKNVVLQVKERGFTFSVLKTYANWHDFSTQARKCWDLYCEVFKPEKVVREAVRYINRIDIPSSDGPVRIEDYFNVYPHVFEKNNEELSGLLLQVQLPQKDGGIAIITQSIVPPERALNVSFILDIDVFDLKRIDPSSEDLWTRVARLRGQKNEIFESSIKDSIRELIK
jgi:uncharacterized protein (TIGR04255 family)